MDVSSQQAMLRVLGRKGTYVMWQCHKARDPAPRCVNGGSSSSSGGQTGLLWLEPENLVPGAPPGRSRVLKH